MNKKPTKKAKIVHIKVLRLTIKKLWFDMIKNDDKKEEYREIKPYWDDRLNEKYSHVLFVNGYAPNSPSVMVECKGIRKGKGKKKWGGGYEQVYVIKLGRILK